MNTTSNTTINGICKRDKIRAYPKSHITEDFEFHGRTITPMTTLLCDGYWDKEEGPFVGVYQIDLEFVDERLDVVLDVNVWDIWIETKYEKLPEKS